MRMESHQSIKLPVKVMWIAWKCCLQQMHNLMWKTVEATHHLILPNCGAIVNAQGMLAIGVCPVVINYSLLDCCIFISCSHALSMLWSASFTIPAYQGFKTAAGCMDFLQASVSTVSFRKPSKSKTAVHSWMSFQHPLGHVTFSHSVIYFYKLCNYYTFDFLLLGAMIDSIIIHPVIISLIFSSESSQLESGMKIRTFLQRKCINLRKLRCSMFWESLKQKSKWKKLDSFLEMKHLHSGQ